MVEKILSMDNPEDSFTQTEIRRVLIVSRIA